MQRRNVGTISVLLLACTLVTGCSRAASGRPVPADHDGPRPVAIALLPDALMDAATISAIMGAPGMRVNDSRSRMFDAGHQFPDRDCMPAWMPVEQSVYADGEWISALVQTLSDSALDHFVIQAATVFATHHAAQDFFDTTARRWNPCGDRTFATSKAGYADTPWTFDTVADVDSTLWMTQHQDDSAGWSCQRALRVSNNVAIDVLACKHYVGDEAVTIAHGIDSRLPSV